MNKIAKLNIKEEKHLAYLLGCRVCDLYKICDNLSSDSNIYYIQWTHTGKNGKERPMVKVVGELLPTLNRLKSIFQKIELSPCMHGGVKKHSIITNARPHLHKKYIMSFDIANHFPSTSNNKIYLMFCNDLGCSPNVSRILTRLTTFNYGLPQGSPTSVFVSNLVTYRLSERLLRFSRIHKMYCSQYVDDYTFSGNYDISKHKNKIVKIIQQEGFTCNPNKTKLVPSSKEQVVTGIRVNGSKPDIPKEKIIAIKEQIVELQNQFEMKGFIPMSKFCCLENRIKYIERFNPGAAKPLFRKVKQLKLEFTN